jgi:acyl carrier protein
MPDLRSGKTTFSQGWVRYNDRRKNRDERWQAGWNITMQTFDPDVRGRIVALVKSILDQNGIVADIDSAARLVDVGLTSMDMVNLMLGVESEFDLMIPQDEITPENFRSVETLERMIAGQLRSEKAA